MSDYQQRIKASWLHISDLHVFPEADTRFILEDYLKLAKVISPQFLVVTGDFRHKKYKTDFSLAKNYLESIINIFHISKEDTFLVPGNHDVNTFYGRNDAIAEIRLKTMKDYNVYAQYMSTRETLYDGFGEYEDFVHDFYSDSSVKDTRVTTPSQIQSLVWNNQINIVLLNTAIISDGDGTEQIIDINALSNCCINPQFPTIMLGHHGIETLFRTHQERLTSYIDNREVSAYLHGDIHKYANNPIQKISTPNRTIPSIACSKSAPQSGDGYSDIGVVYYEWKSDNNTYVQAYRWSSKSGFVEDSSYYYEINNRFYFPMLYNRENIIDRTESLLGRVKSLAQNQQADFMVGEWVDEAEEIWQENHPEAIGRSLLLFYYNKAKIGMYNEMLRARCIHRELKQMEKLEHKTVRMLDETEQYLFSTEG